MSRAVVPIAVAGAAPLAALHRACFPDDPWDARALAEVLGMPGAFGFMASDGADPTGFVLARDLGGEIEILSLGTLPDRRRRGIGGALMRAVIGEAGRRGALSLVLEVAVDNEAARRLYAGLGFGAVGRRARYYRRGLGTATDAMIMSYRVTG